MPKTHQHAHLAIGLMAGTSLDGIDAALVEISGTSAQPKVRLRRFLSIPYRRELRDRLLRVAAGESTTTGEISQLNFLLGKLFGEAALRVCKTAKVPAGKIDFIGSHGQTIYHQGAASRECGHSISSTLQIGEPSVISLALGVPVVADFRVADMAAGGQGAPLIPMVDWLLLRDRKQGTVALNLGGIGNITVIPAGCEADKVYGFDTGPGNMIMDALVREFSQGKKRFDTGGKWAAKGRVLEPLLQEMLKLSFFAERPPKSAGREQFGSACVKRHFLNSNAPPEDLLRTALELTVRSVAGAMERFVLPKVRVHRLIVSGGGAHNKFLLHRLGDLLPRLSLHLSEEFGLPVDAKEAMAFALLADLTLHAIAGNIPSVTGAKMPVVLGKIVSP